MWSVWLSVPSVNVHCGLFSMQSTKGEQSQRHVAACMAAFLLSSLAHRHNCAPPIRVSSSPLIRGVWGGALVSLWQQRFVRARTHSCEIGGPSRFSSRVSIRSVPAIAFPYSCTWMSWKPSVEELERQAGELRRRSRELQQTICELRRKANAAVPGNVATPWMQSVALRIFALADFDATYPLQYLQMKGRPTDQGQLRMWLEEISAEDRRGLVSPRSGTSRESRQLAEAQRFMREAQVVSWIRRQNEEKGIAPTPGAVIEHAAAGVGRSCRRRSKYSWLRRVVQRWGGRKGVFGVGDQLTLETFRDKVGCGHRSSVLPSS